jgi:hypothetical protein
MTLKSIIVLYGLLLEYGLSVLNGPSTMYCCYIIYLNQCYFVLVCMIVMLQNFIWFLKRLIDRLEHE